jgi:hypothetical protein
MASDEELRAVARMAVRNKLLNDILFGVSNDFARLIEPTLKRCEHSRCKKAATVVQVDLKVHMCDYHAASGVVIARRNLMSNPDNTITDPVTLLRLRLATDECWADLPNAEQIRRLQEYTWELQKGDEPSPPVDPAELH